MSSNPQKLQTTNTEAVPCDPTAEPTRPLAVYVVGPTCSGKTEAGRHLAGIGFTWLEPSEYIKQQIPLNLPILERLQAVDDYFQRVGKDYVARKLLSHCLSPDVVPPLVITGCRQSIEIALVRESFKTIVIALQTDDTVRFSRSANRARPDVTLSFDTFLRATAWEYALGLAEIILQADHIVINNGATCDLHTQLQNILRLV